MKNKYTYKIKFLSIYIVAVIFAIFLISFTFDLTKSSDISTISDKYIKDTAQEKSVYLTEYLGVYTSSIKAISKDKLFKEYLTTNKNKNYIENYFISLKRSLPFTSQIRYINNNGYEIIRVNSKDNTINLVPKNMLQNKRSRYYVKEFLALKKGEIGFSKIDLNVENGKIVEPKEPTVRIGLSVYDNNNIKKGIVIFNVLLNDLFKNLGTTELYDIILIDDNGSFLIHNDNKYGLLGDGKEYTLKDEFPNVWEKILSDETLLTDKFYSFTINHFGKTNKIKMLLKLKYYELSQKNASIKNDFIIVLITISIFFLPLIFYFAYLPDTLVRKSIKELSINTLTGLPNRISLKNDLKTESFDNNLVILVYINNLFRIQNTYGYNVTNKLLVTFSKFLKQYDKVDKLYVNNYNSFAIKYIYEDEADLKYFLQTLLSDLEKNQFNLENEDVEFLLHSTIGISNPTNINHNTKKLQEAENALEMALDKHINVDIYGTVHEKNIDSKKQNINLAYNIKKYIDADKILIYYQPIYNNFTEKIEKYECLMRIKGTDGILYPDTFLPIAKEINQYNRLSYILVEKAFEFFNNKDYEFSINLSINDLYDMNFQKYLFDKIHQYDIANKLVIEIVESESINNYEIFFDFAKKIKEIGSKIAIDDFGSGYSNFSYIIELSEYIDYLKIDGSLVKGIVESHKIQILIGSLKFLSDNLGIKTIAEYVEDGEVLKYLSSIGVDYSQGYYIGKPEPTLV